MSNKQYTDINSKKRNSTVFNTEFYKPTQILSAKEQTEISLFNRQLWKRGITDILSIWQKKKSTDHVRLSNCCANLLSLRFSDIRPK